MLFRSNDLDGMKADSEALEKAFYGLSEQLYKQNGGQNGANAGFDPNASGFGGAQSGAQGGDDTVYNADFEDKTGDNK